MAKSTMKLGIIFEAPFTQDKFDKHSTAPAFASLREQIITYAEALKKDPNVLIIDAFMLTDPGDYAKRAVQPADAHVAELKANQTENINKALAKEESDTKSTGKTKAAPAKAPATTPVTAPAKSTKAASTKAAAKPTAEPEKKQKVAVAEKITTGISFGPGAELLDQEDEEEATTTKTAVQAEDVKAALDKVFQDLKRTEKSTKILTALAEAGGEITSAELMKKTKLNSNDLGSWMNSMIKGKKVKYIEKTGRGAFKFNFDKI